jgi:hypothetical protein
MFKPNTGTYDRWLRVIVAFLLFLGAAYALKGVEAIIVYIIAILLFLTAITGYSVLFALFGMNTWRDQKN